MNGMGEAEDVIASAVETAHAIKRVLETDGATVDDLKKAAMPFDHIEKEIERLLADG